MHDGRLHDTTLNPTLFNIFENMNQIET
jgi:hypothetical protein